MKTVTIQFDVPDDAQFMFCTLDYLRDINGELELETQEKYTGDIKCEYNKDLKGM